MYSVMYNTCIHPKQNKMWGTVQGPQWRWSNLEHKDYNGLQGFLKHTVLNNENLSIHLFHNYSTFWILLKCKVLALVWKISIQIRGRMAHALDQINMIKGYVVESIFYFCKPYSKTRSWWTCLRNKSSPVTQCCLSRSFICGDCH